MRASTGHWLKNLAEHPTRAAGRLNTRIPSSSTMSAMSGIADRTSSTDVPCGRMVTLLRPFGARDEQLARDGPVARVERQRLLGGEAPVRAEPVTEIVAAKSPERRIPGRIADA